MSANVHDPENEATVLKCARSVLFPANDAHAFLASARKATDVNGIPANRKQEMGIIGFDDCALLDRHTVDFTIWRAEQPEAGQQNLADRFSRGDADERWNLSLLDFDNRQMRRARREHKEITPREIAG